MSTPDPLALLDFTPAPLTCGFKIRPCTETAAARIWLTCGCVDLYCQAHTVQMLAIMAHPEEYSLVCHIHQMFDVQMKEWGKIA
jgi:hypothetical protein